MAKLPNRLVIEITNTDKVDELGNPVISFESKDYAECVEEELEKIREKIKSKRDLWIKGRDAEWHTYDRCIGIIDKHISELKGEQNES